MDLGYILINTAHRQFVQVVQNKHVWDMPKVKEHENDHVELLEVVNNISCTIDELVEDINFYRGDVDHMVVKEQIIWQVDDDFINDEKRMSNYLRIETSISMNI